MEDAGGGISTIEHGGMTITSTGQDPVAVKASLEQGSPDTAEATEKPEKADKPKRLSPSDHARELGKRGGQAAAERRAEAKEAAEEKPEPGKARDGAGEPREGQDGDEGEEATDKDEPLSKRAQRRIEVATKKQAEARRELEAERAGRAQERARYEAELAHYRATHGGRNPGEQPEGERQAAPERDTSGKPREEDFERYSDYLDARDQWNRSEWTREQEGKQHAERARETYKDNVSTFLKHMPADLLQTLDPALSEMKPLHEMERGEQITADNFIATEALWAREYGPAVLKYLSDNPEELEHIRTLPPTGVQVEMRAIARFVRRNLGSKPDATAGASPGEGERPPKVATSKATPPVRPVSGAPHIAEADAPRADEENDFDRWNRRTSKR